MYLVENATGYLLLACLVFLVQRPGMSSDYRVGHAGTLLAAWKVEVVDHFRGRLGL
jgi:hypothetical protein